MAQEIQIAGAGTTAKTRNPIAVAVLAVVTLGIYLVCWWYFINRELADLGRAKGTTELGDSPAKSTLALFPGALLIVPAIWTTVTTFQRVQAAQRLTRSDADQRLARGRPLHRHLAGSLRLHAERAEQRLEGAGERERARGSLSQPASVRILATARVSPSSSKRCGTQLPISCAGPSSSSEPAAPLIA